MFLSIGKVHFLYLYIFIAGPRWQHTRAAPSNYICKDKGRGGSGDRAGVVHEACGTSTFRRNAYINHNLCDSKAICLLTDGDGYPNLSYPSKKSSWRSAAARRARSCCSAKTLLRRLPILAWLPKYSIRNGLADLIAGTVKQSLTYVK